MYIYIYIFYGHVPKPLVYDVLLERRCAGGGCATSWLMGKDYEFLWFSWEIPYISLAFLAKSYESAIFIVSVVLSNGLQIPQKSNDISEILRKSMEFISNSDKLHRKSWEIPANIIGFHKKLLGWPWEWIRVISAGGAPQAPWRHTEGCARGAPTSFRIGPEFVGSLTKIKALVLW